MQQPESYKIFHSLNRWSWPGRTSQEWAADLDWVLKLLSEAVAVWLYSSSFLSFPTLNPVSYSSSYILVHKNSILLSQNRKKNNEKSLYMTTRWIENIKGQKSVKQRGTYKYELYNLCRNLLSSCISNSDVRQGRKLWSSWKTVHSNCRNQQVFIHAGV